MKSHATPLLATIALVLGCAPGSETPDAGPEEEDPNTDACEHGTEGPFVDVAASSMSPPDVSEAHTAYRIATEDLGGGERGGGGAYASAEAGDHYLFLSDHVDVKVQGSDANEVTLEASVHELDACDEIAMYHLVELGVGTYRVELGPTEVETVTLVVVLGGDHAGEE